MDSSLIRHKIFNFRLICQPKNLPFNFKFTVEEADKEFQPKLDPNSFKFEDINDDCLLKIAAHLDIIDIVNLGQSSTRLQSFAQLIFKKKTHLSFGENSENSPIITDSNLESILQAMGNYIESIDCFCLESKQLNLLWMYCKNVTELKLTAPHKCVSIKKYESFFANIEKLKIDDDDDISNTELKVFASSKKLKLLHLNLCWQIDGNFFTEWNNFELKDLRVNDCQTISSDRIAKIVRKNKLVKFSSDNSFSFETILSLPPECLSLLEELELNCKTVTNIKKDKLNLKALKQLSHLTLNLEEDKKCNSLFVVLSQIPTLTSLTINGIEIDAHTLGCMGSLKSLRKVRFNFYKNLIGAQFYSSLRVHLPEITEITMYEEDDEGDILDIYEAEADRFVKEKKSISAMISSHINLKYFAHSEMTWDLLDVIIQERMRLKRPTIEFGLSASLFCHPRKVSATLLYST